MALSRILWNKKSDRDIFPRIKACLPKCAQRGGDGREFRSNKLSKDDESKHSVSFTPCDHYRAFPLSSFLFPYLSTVKLDI
jgi:hypothetical protein